MEAIDPRTPPDVRPRRGESRVPCFRSDRLFVSDGRWFFCTREGRDIGPFVTRSEAESALRDFVRRVDGKSQVREPVTTA